jgi:4'-phosphopantetheinyl transferase
LRLILGRYLDAPPASLMFAADDNGRPFLAGERSGLHFNLSHSGDVALIALAHAAVGVDVERIKEMSDFMKIARKHFAASELESLQRVAAEEQPKAFHRIWTRKEAFVKATGLGLRFPLNAFSTGSATEPPSLMVEGHARPDWTLIDLKPGEGYVGALAVAAPDAAVRCFQPDWPSLLDRVSALR